MGEMVLWGRKLAGVSIFFWPRSATDGLRRPHLSLHVFYQPLYETNALRGRNRFVLRFYRLRCLSSDLRWPHLSLHDERWGRKACLVVASSTSFVLPLGAKAQSFRCSSSPHQTHFVGLWRGPLFALFPRTHAYCT